LGKDLNWVCSYFALQYVAIGGVASSACSKDDGAVIVHRAGLKAERNDED